MVELVLEKRGEWLKLPVLQLVSSMSNVEAHY